MNALKNPFRLSSFLLPAVLLCWLAKVPLIEAQSLQIRPQRLDLGTVKPDTRKIGKLFLFNPGEDELKVEASVSGERFAISTVSLPVPGGDEAVFEVLFEGGLQGEYQGELLLQIRGFLRTERHSVSLLAKVAKPQVGIDPDPAQGLDMGVLRVGESSRRMVVLNNLGSVAVAIDTMYLAVPDPAFRLTAPERVDLGPGESIEVQLDFEPPAGDLYRNRLVILAADLNPSWVEFSLQGEGNTARARFSPIPEVGLLFGNLELGKTHSLELTILNQGQLALSIDRLESSSEVFSVGLDVERIDPLEPGGRLRIPIVFQPRYEGASSAMLTVWSNDSERSKAEIPLLGEARKSPPRIEILNEKVTDFGRVAVGKNQRDHLLVWNQGGTPFTVTMDLEGEARHDFELGIPAVLLQPGEFRKVALKFTPRENGDRSATLLVMTESGVHPLELQGIGKFIELTPTSLEFDQVVVGRFQNLQTEIFNFGNADFTITNVISSNPEVFAVHSQVSPANKFVLPADGMRPLMLSVNFLPPARGLFSGVVQLQGYWDDAFETREVLLNGTGIAADIELHPAGPFEFDHVIVGTKEAQPIIATNTGDTDLEVEVHPESSEAYIEPGDFSLKPGQSTQLQLVFHPQALGKRDTRIRLISNAVKEKALPLQVAGRGSLPNVDLEKVVSVVVSRKTQFETMKVSWNNTPIVLADQTKIDLVFKIPEDLRQAMIGRKFFIEWTKLDHNYDEQGGPNQLELQIQDVGETRVLAEKLNLRLLEDGNRRVRLKVSTQNHPNAPLYSVSQLFEAGGWKWEFEAKPLVSFFSLRPAREWKDDEGNVHAGQTERLVGLPAFAFFGFHNAESQGVSGIHLMAIGNVLEALSTENSIAVSMGVAVSFYKDRFLFGIGKDVYDNRSREKRRITKDYIMTVKYWGLFR